MTHLNWLLLFIVLAIVCAIFLFITSSDPEGRGATWSFAAFVGFVLSVIAAIVTVGFWIAASWK